MPNRRNINLSVGDTVSCVTLRQRNNIQVYLPRAAVRYLACRAGETVYVTAGPNGALTVTRAVPAGVTPRPAQPHNAVAPQPAPVQPVPANPALAQLAALQAQIQQLTVQLGAGATPPAPVDPAADEVRRYRRQRS